MLNLTVKTMDSQNHTFSIDDDMTVRQFKECIAERTAISVDSQRLIYFGRVLMDEKLLREYDVNGKVVHLVQRAPPSVRRNNSGRTSNSDNTSNSGNNRGTPIFRALAIPMNASNNGTPQAAAPSLNPSSTLCMNRITVAKYMLECTNNIAAYLEDPSRGLNNTAMDILAQQTMESTVLEVGISAVSTDDITQHHVQHLVQAISSAFRQNNIANVRVMQPGNEQTGPSFQDIIGISIPTATDVIPPPNQQSSQPNLVPDYIRIIPDTPPNSRDAQPARSDIAVSTPTGQRQQTTSTQTLAEVVQQMRAVQTRIEPFIQQYYDILLNDPTYDTTDNPEQRFTSQRVFDRVSEALHYMSHAQHAISDLMLDLSTNSPRHLCCRPILVEQSAFVSSGFAVPHNGTVTHVIRPNGSNNNETIAGIINNNNTANNNNNTAQTATTNTESQSSPATQPPPPQQPQPPQQQQQRRLATIIQQGQFPTRTPNANSISFGNPRRIVIPTQAMERPAEFYLIGNQSPPNEVIVNPSTAPIQVARLIQAVMNSAPMHADVHVEINGPNNMTSGPQTTTTTTNNTTDSANNELTINIHLGGETNQQPRVTTATHPTTSTQTRSTSRPQVHLTSLPGPQVRNLRPVPANMLSAFDRFLPCNSHHIRDNHSNGQQQTPRSSRAQTLTQVINDIPEDQFAFRFTERPENIFEAEPAANLGGGPFNNTPAVNLGGFAYNIPVTIFGNEYTMRDLFTATPAIMNRMREGFLSHIQTTLFSGSSITDENMTNGLNQSIEHLDIFLQPLSQFDLPDFDSRRSIENLIKDFLSKIFILIRDDQSTEFATRLINKTSIFIKRFFAILLTCVGRTNAELYLTQLVQLAITSNIFLGPETQVMSLINEHMNLEHVLQNIEDVREYIVIRAPDIITTTTAAMETDEIEESGPMNVDHQEEVLSVLNREHVPPPPPIVDDDDEENLPSIVVGSEPWHYNFPTSSWIPVITRDIGRQRRQNSQPPFSDAYISGMSSKRRKIISENKPPNDVPTMISEGVRRAIQSSGINPNTNISIDEVTTAISTDVNVQTSYKEALKTSVQERLKNDPEYNRDRYPSSSKYFNNNK